MKWNFLKPNRKNIHHVAVQFFDKGIAISAGTSQDHQSVFIAAAEDERIGALKTYITEQRLQYSPCSIVLDSNYKLLLIDAPNVPEEEFAQAIPWLVKDLIDYPIKEAAVEAFPLPHKGDKPEKLYAVITRLETLKELKEITDTSNLILNNIDINELALIHVVDAISEPDTSTGLIFGKGGALEFIMVRNGELYFSRKIGDIAHLNDQERLSSIYLELQRSIDYCQVTLHQPTINKVYLTPYVKALYNSNAAITAKLAILDINQLSETLDYRCLSTYGELINYEATD